MIDTFYNYPLNIDIFKELSAVNSFILSCYFLILFYISFFGEKNRTDKDKLPIDVRKDKHNAWTHGLLWRISLCAKVPGGCRLQFEQIARDVQCRKPSSKDDIMWSTWFCCYSNCDSCFNSFRKENCMLLPFQSISFARRFNLLRVHLVPLLEPFGYGQETEQYRAAA